mmetsp:Transcript_8530/g.13380  ORF Transcript_8530/g.13380 Transcript_8530/m.13380 type:complete len:93 (+) Transcript_8530:80-358(+)
MDQWINAENMWLRRVAIICQNTRGRDTDSKRLYDYCKQHAHDKEFFIAKAIGWALRSHARVDKKGVQKFVRDNEEILQPLSIREALKHVGRV